MGVKDKLQKFLIDDLNIRGEYIQLNQSLAQIEDQHHYPQIILDYINELSIATVLLTALVKIKGRVTIELEAKGSVEWIVCKCNDNLGFSSLAKWDDEALASDYAKDLKSSYLRVTIQLDDSAKPYQAIVPLDNLSVTDAIETYFAQSEQLDTKIRIENNEGTYTGILLQKLPNDNEDDQNWAEVICGLVNTSTEEINKLNAIDLLPQMFANSNVIAYPLQEVKFECGCSKDKMENAIKIMGEKDAIELINLNKFIYITCEFCNSKFNFNRTDVRALF